MDDDNNNKDIPNDQRSRFGGIRGVACEAGVSTATVSRVFNRPDTVKSQTRERVLEAAKSLNYIPDSAARALSSQVTRRIGALIPTMNDSIFACFIDALHLRLSKDGYTLLVGIYNFDPQTETKELHSLIESGVDGIVLCGSQRSIELYNLLERRQIPFLNANIYTPDSPHPSVGPDYRSSMAEATRYLLDLGHRSIGLIDDAPHLNDRADERLAGIKEALKDRGLDLPGECHVERSFSFEGGRNGLSALLKHTSNLTAVICGNDVLAIGALFEARDRCISIPDELSIIGFDNLELAAQTSPDLTTINVPTGEMGARAAEKLLLTLANKPASHATHIKTNLIIRGSTGPRKT